MTDAEQARVQGAAEQGHAYVSALSRVMTLVAITLGLTAVGTWAGRGLAPGAAVTASFAVLGMVLVQAFGGARFRVGTFAVAWLFAVGFVLGLGIGPTIAHYTAADPSAVYSAAVTTALVVAAVAAGGYTVDRDLSAWLRPLAFVLLGLVILTIVLFLAGSGGSPLISLAIAVVSAACLFVDFNYVRRHATDDDIVYLATGIFVAIINIFLSVLDLSGRE